jgi:hypothetical protein
MQLHPNANSACCCCTLPNAGSVHEASAVLGPARARHLARILLKIKLHTHTQQQQQQELF